MMVHNYMVILYIIYLHKTIVQTMNFWKECIIVTNILNYELYYEIMINPYCQRNHCPDFPYENAPPNIRLLSNIWGALHYLHRAIDSRCSIFSNVSAFLRKTFIISFDTWFFYSSGKPTEIIFQ